MHKKKLGYFSAIILSLMFISASVVFADDDDKYGEYDDDYKAPVAVDTTQASTTTTSKPSTKTYKQTIVVTPAQIVTENQIQTIIVPDTDNDGIADSEDPHPSIPEIFIVEDANGNGIVDTFEYGI
jgi:hypothetical protein